MIPKNPGSIFLKKVRTPPGVGIHKMASSIILHVLFRMGWKEEGNQPETGLFGDGPEIISMELCGRIGYRTQR
ncbi:hypothetical protein CEXT_119531 [Caerostris extrusa]|uniref:Uncharacterized protein n=1 Tax=Caerostris extrusa TaxID=172846 RepID=A0AAV4VUJ4_CAEEX|nr:hypothetical protein CEXT_119531 [Caerostris extrusa]